MKLKGIMAGLCLLLSVAACTHQEPTGAAEGVGENENVKQAYGPDDPQYTIKADFNEEKHQVTGHLKVEFTNNLDKKLKNIYFNLWPNAGVFLTDGGEISVSNVKYNGNGIESQVIDRTKLKLAETNLNAGKNGSVEMDFTVDVPERQDRFGWDGNNVSLGNWFPILAVYDNEGWNLDPYYSDGESFYSLTGNFDVDFTVPNKEVVAATGTESGQPEKKDGKTTYHYKAENVRDFALNMNPDFKKKTIEADGTKINVYYTPDRKHYSQMITDTAKMSIETFNKQYGKYPWPELDVVTMTAWFGGMEYPSLVMISLNDRTNEFFARESTAHEIAHQWFYGAIGDNEYDEPWLDEAFASFASLRALGAIADSSSGTPMPNADYYHLTSPVKVFTEHAGEKSSGGPNPYLSVIYRHGASTLYDLEKKLGEDVFDKAMQTYYKREKFKISTTADFVNTMEEVSGKDLSDFFKKHDVYVKETVNKK